MIQHWRMANGGVQRLDRPDEELLLRAMVQTFLDRSLCLAAEDAEAKQLEAQYALHHNAT